MRYVKLIIIVYMALLQNACAQPNIAETVQNYPFINYEANKIYSPANANMAAFYSKMARLLQVGDKQVNIVHIGDSHIQADYFSGRLRKLLQSYYPGGNGGRGFVFPYTMARTNNPVNYKVSYTGHWQSCKNIEAGKDCTLGLAGISVTTYDTSSSFTLSSSVFEDIVYDYTRIRIFYSSEDSAHDLQLENIGSVQISEVKKGVGVIEWVLESPANEVVIRIKNSSGNKKAFTLYGVALETFDPGIIYHSTGVNGAQVTSFLRCRLLEEQLAALSPDLIIISLGTNDAYVNDFDEVAYMENFKILIRRIKEHSPNAAILLTTSGDCYRNKMPNQNNIKVKNAIYSLANNENCSVWDFFTVMGGLGSAQKWKNSGLSANDRVHFTKNGYELQGDLLFDALTNGFYQYIGSKK